MALIFPAGTTVTLADAPAGSPTTIAGIKSVSENTSEMKMGDVTALADGVIKELPSNRVDPGEVEITVFLDDTAVATNFKTIVATKRNAGTKVILNINLPGTHDDTNRLVGPYSGYITQLGEPAIETGDDALTWKFKIRNSAA